MNARAAAVAFFLGLAGGAAAGCPGEPEIVHKTAIEHGQALFEDPAVSGATFNTLSCATCHDARAGDSDENKSGAPLAGAVRRPTYWGGSEDRLLGSINACLYYFMQASEPWTGDEDEATAIYAYLESLDADASEADRGAVPFSIAPLSIPATGDAARGQALYETACANCHGAKTSGEGRPIETAPLLPQQTLNAHPSPDYTDAERRLVFVEKTRHGVFLGYGGQMPPLSAERLSAEDVPDILAYLGVP